MPAMSPSFGQQRWQLMLLWSLLTSSASANEAFAERADTDRKVDFDTQVMPVLTKAGCNAGACHGAAAGRGELQLSLYGSRPDDDFKQLTAAMLGRRIDRADPDNSLMLLKATESISHGGGPRLDIDDHDYALLHRWISEGATRTDHRSLRNFSFTATSSTVKAAGDAVTLQALAEFSDGSRSDVLPWTVLSTTDESAVQIEVDKATVLRPGRHLLMARFLDRVEPLYLTLPFRSNQELNGAKLHSSVARSADKVDHGLIDRLINKRLQELGLQPRPLASDATLLRRITVDLLGRLPTLEEQQKFTSGDAEPDEERWLQTVDRLLQSDEFTQYWTFRMAKWLRLQNARPNDETDQIYRWLSQQVRNDVPLSATVARLLKAEGKVAEQPLAGFHNLVADPRLQAEFVTEAFMGVRLKCANCHDHPLDLWTQDDYHGLAAIFAGIRRGPNIGFTPAGEVIHPATSEPALPSLPGGPPLEAGKDHRERFADWLTAADNAFFNKAIVNRTWHHLLGRGLVDPVDDLRTTNPGTHPLLLETLSQEFANHGRLRPLIRRICLSQTYRRQSYDNATEAERSYYAAYTSKLLPVEVYLDAIRDVTGVPLSPELKNDRAISQVGFWQVPQSFPDLMQCEAGTACESAAVSISQPALQLHLLNGSLLNDRLEDSDGRIMRSVAAQSNDIVLLEEFYRRILSRPPSDAELTFWSQQLAAANELSSRAIIFQDIVWTLLNSREFLSVH